MHRLVSNKVYLHFVERTRLGRLHQGLLYGAVGLLWLTGAIWLIFHYLLQGADWGATSSVEPSTMKIHGAAAMVFLAVFGSLVPLHLRRGWVLRLNRPSGIAITAVCLLMAASGWALYYAGGENARAVVSAAHWILGLLFPVVIIAHVMAGKRRTAARVYDDAH